LDDPGVYRKFSGFWKIASFWEHRQRPNHHIITFSSGRFCKFTFMQRAKTYIKLIVLAAFYLYPDTGCKKSASYSVPSSSTYRFAAYTGFQPIRAFVNTGEIKDPAVLAKLFIYDSLSVSESAIQRAPYAPAYDSLHFGTSDDGIAYDYAHGSWEFRTERSGNNLTLVAVSPQVQDIDTTIVSVIGNAIVLYSYLLANRRYDSGPFYRYDWTYEAFGTQTADDKIVMPVMISGLIEPTVAYTSAVYNNRFNPAFDYRLLPPGDTLFFREFSALMQKQ